MTKEYDENEFKTNSKKIDLTQLFFRILIFMLITLLIVKAIAWAGRGLLW